MSDVWMCKDVSSCNGVNSSAKLAKMSVDM
jgi:hypothetical protein